MTKSIVRAPSLTGLPSARIDDAAPTSSPRFWFASEGFENTSRPCLCFDDPEGGDPHVLGLFSTLYRPDHIIRLVTLANAQLDALEVSK